MLRLLGSLLVFSGTCFLGWKAGDREKRRVLLLRDMIDGLDELSRELSFRLTPLPQLLRMIGTELGGPAGTFFLSCGCQAAKGEDPLQEIWEREAKKLKEYTNRESVDILLRVGRFLGRSDWQEEREYLEAACVQLKEILREERVETLQRGQLYRTLGPAAGGLLVLLLL